MNWLSKISQQVRNTQERIVGAAVFVGNKIYVADHHAEAFVKAFEDIFNADLGPYTGQNSTWDKFDAWVPKIIRQKVDGFLTSDKRFVDRGAAWSIARKAGQLREHSTEGYLDSDDVHF